MLKRFCLPILFSVALFIFSCGPDSKKNVSETTSNKALEQEQEFKLQLSRFETDLFSIPFDSVAEHVPSLKTQYGTFLDIFSNRIIRIGKTDKPDFPQKLKSFITDRYMYLTYQKVKEVYPDLNREANEMEVAFKKYSEYFPEKTIPHVYTLISGYYQSIIAADSILGISLDKYLGTNCEYYFNLGYPLYQRRLMNRENLVSDAMKGWCYSEFQFSDSGENVLTNLLYEGKIAYILKRLMPQKHDSIIFGYSNDQLKWCQNNVNEMWTFLIERKLVFSTDYMTINKLINPAPFTSLFTNESPGRAIVWVGYKIIDSYMKNNKVSLAALMADENYQQILEKSKFKPK